MAGFVLEIVEGPEAGRRIPLGGDTFEIGRGGEVGVDLPHDELVSRNHVRLTPQGDGVLVEDLDSRNGTFVNGDEITSPAHLGPGDQLLVGVTVLELQKAEATTDSGATSVRAIPMGLTGLRPLPAPGEKSVTAIRQLPSALAVAERKPDFVSDELRGGRAERDAGKLSPLLDMHTKSQARSAPLAIFVLVAIVVLIALALR